MNFWWVNHKQTFRQEFGGGYVWCPKRKNNGNRNHFYETMRIVRRGDLVLSYANAAVQGYGLAQTYCYSCPQPDEFGNVGKLWDQRGWRVDVSFQRFESPLRPADHTALIAPLLPQRYSPIRANGFGNQGAYFSEIPKELAFLILQLSDPAAHRLITGLSVREEATANHEGLVAISEWEDLQVARIVDDESLRETQKKALVNSRRGQGLFRQRVAGIENRCRITRVENSAHLVASHIKPWRESNHEERLSGANGLFLTPSIDHLFDRGFISFENNGELILSPIADNISLEKMGVQTDAVTNVGGFNIDQKHFLDYHREEILLKASI